MTSTGLSKVILDYDGTLTAEEEQVGELAERSIGELSRDILKVPLAQVRADYDRARARILAEPHRFWWEVNGLIAAYGDEGAFITNTTTIQTLLRSDPAYVEAVAESFPDFEYDPIMDCSNHLFHTHTFNLKPHFREGAEAVLDSLVGTAEVETLILSSSKGDKVEKNLRTLGFEQIRVLGDTRQYAMDPAWDKTFVDDEQGEGQVFQVDDKRTIDLRRPAYYKALKREQQGAGGLMVVADTFSMPGALPMMLGIPFVLLRTPYTPSWCDRYVAEHPCGHVLENLALLPELVATLL
jgi:hypothetical protein